MPFFQLLWLNSMLNCLFSHSHTFLKVPDYLASTIPAKVFSVADNQIKTPYVSAVSIPVNSGILPFSQSLTPVPAFSFLGWWGGEQTNSQTTDKAFLQLQNQAKITKKLLCPSETKQNFTYSASNYQPVFSAEASPSEVQKLGLTQRIFNVIQTVFQWPRQVKARLNKVAVEVVRIDENDSTDNKSHQRRGLLLSSQLGKGAVIAKPATNQEWYQVRVNKVAIAQIPDETQAKLMAQRLVDSLEEPNVKASQLQPTFEAGKPAGKIGDRLLFVIDDAITSALQREPQILAIEWVNNLRTALNVKPLGLAQAQSKMFGLVDSGKKLEGLASWYGGFFHGRLTANGETYNQFALTAAHPSLPFGTFLKVTNLKNGDEVIVRVNDRGPYIAPRTLDLSLGAARCLNSEETGVVPYQAIVMRPPEIQ